MLSHFSRRYLDCNPKVMPSEGECCREELSLQQWKNSQTPETQFLDSELYIELGFNVIPVFQYRSYIKKFVFHERIHVSATTVVI